MIWFLIGLVNVVLYSFTGELTNDHSFHTSKGPFVFSLFLILTGPLGTIAIIGMYLRVFLLLLWTFNK
jgi:hypothetical protein